MKTMFLVFILILSAIFTVGCERAKLLTTTDFTPDPQLHWELNSLEDFPSNVSLVVSDMIKKTKLSITEFEKFKVAYFLIPESHLDLIYSIEKHKSLIERIKNKVSGEDYVRFFIHPDNIHLYHNLTSSYRLIEQKESQYMAAAHKGLKSLIVWNETAPDEEFFLLYNINNQGAISPPRYPASSSNKDDAISIIFSNGSHKFSGQELIKLPQ